MPHIKLRLDLFGITSLLDFRPESAAPLCSRTQILLRGESTLTESEREMIAAYVSSLNDCTFCSSAHTATTCLLPGGKETGIMPMEQDLETFHVSEKMNSLLQLAAKVQQGGYKVQIEDVENARNHGASDMEIHDTVLIAALFCLYNRYVDGLATLTPTEPEFYELIGKRLASRGYLMPEEGYDPANYKTNK